MDNYMFVNQIIINNWGGVNQGFLNFGLFGRFCLLYPDIYRIVVLLKPIAKLMLVIGLFGLGLLKY